jgi:hypothetical protein
VSQYDANVLSAVLRLATFDSVVGNDTNVCCSFASYTKC